MIARRAVMVLVAVIMLGPALPATASHGNGPKFQAWQKAATIEYDETRCLYDISLWGQEFGKHGVTQFKFKFWRFLGAISEYSPTALPLRSISAETVRLYSSTVPDDGRNMYSHARWIGSVVNGTPYTLRAKAVGIRPSWWQKDLTATVHFGYCDALAFSPGTL